MVKQLKEENTKEILEYCFQNEKENFFTISNLLNEENPFKNSQILAKYKAEQIVGLLTFFNNHQNLVVHSQSKNIIKELIDNFNDKKDIKFVVCYKKYADTIIEHLKNNYSIEPKKSRLEDVFELTKGNFQDLTTQKSDYRKGKLNQKQEIAEFAAIINRQPIESAKPELIKPNNEYLLYVDNKLVARAALHGTTKSYFQIGGVGTLESYRRKGYAKEIVSYLCKENLKTKNGILFTSEDNIAAQIAYSKIGFKKFDKLILAQF